MKKKIQTYTRRSNKEGSIIQRSDGRWVAVATVGYDENGKIIRKHLYGKSRMEVADKLSKLTNRIETNTYSYTNNKTINDLMTEWLLIFKKNQVSPRTFENVIRNYNLHIKSKVGNMKLEEVNNIVIQKVLNGMIDNGYSLSVVKKIKFLFNQFFNYAVENNLTKDNPTTKTKVKSTERKIYNENENSYKAIPPELREKFLMCLEKHNFLKPLCITMMFAGLRTGEVLALKWKNIDFLNKIITVEKGVTIVPKFNSEGKVIERKNVIGETKTACSVRNVPMPNILLEVLENHKINQSFKEQTYNNNLTSPNSFVFANNDGSLRSYSGTRKIFSRFLEKHNLDNLGIHFHGLRHTYSNMLFEADQNPKIIQSLLGHKSVKTTIVTYNSIDKSYFKKATEILNNKFSKKTSYEDLNNEDIDTKIKELLLEKEKRKLENLII